MARIVKCGLIQCSNPINDESRPVPEIQQAMFDKHDAEQKAKEAAAMVRPGGFVFYSVCSLQPEERRAVVAAVTSADSALLQTLVSPDATGDGDLIDSAGDLQTLPSHWAERGALDGFYGALLRKSL